MQFALRQGVDRLGHLADAPVELLDRVPVARLSIDRSGIGMHLAENLTRDYPHYVNGWFNLALALFQNGDTVGAVRALDQASRLANLTPEQKEQIDRLRAALAGSGSR